MDKQAQYRIRMLLVLLGTIVCVVIAAAWAGSLRWWFYYSTDDYLYSLSRGCAHISVNAPDLFRGFAWIGKSSQPEFSGLHVVVLYPYVEWVPGSTSSVSIPLWMPFLAVGIPTAILWRRRGRVWLGHCRECRYDLTGNVSGVCPECGCAVRSLEKGDCV
jgi:hypothetical protein